MKELEFTKWETFSLWWARKFPQWTWVCVWPGVLQIRIFFLKRKWEKKDKQELIKKHIQDHLAYMEEEKK